MFAVIRIQRIRSADMLSLALKSNALHLGMSINNMKLGTAAHCCGQPLRQFRKKWDNWNTQELLVAGSTMAALTAIAKSEALCELLGQGEEETGVDDSLARRSNDNLCPGNDDSNTMSLYFDTEYEAKKILGCGSFGVVMQCVHKQTGCIAAVKMVQDSDENQEEVKREKQAFECLERAGGHENIVGYKGAYYHNDFHYIVLEYVPGISLHSFMDKHHTLNATWSLRLVSQLASALQFMHKANVVHRDLKPENVMAVVNCTSNSCSDRENIRLKIIDFGSVSLHSDKPRTTILSGTRCYWSPEVLECQEMTPAMDMWALGCILFILISGRHPFDLTGSSTEDEILERVKTSSLSFLNPVWQHVPTETKKLIRGLLTKDPYRRLSADQVLEHSAIIAAMK